MAVNRIQDRTFEFQSVMQQAARKQAQLKGAGTTAQKKRSMMSDYAATQRAATHAQQQQPLMDGYGDAAGAAGGAGATSRTVSSRSEFARRAADVGKGIASTMAKLERLALLAKRKSMFDDKATEVNELTYTVKQSLAALNQQISGLQGIARQQAGKSEEGEHRKNVVFLLQDRLTSVSANFKEVLEVRTKNLQSTRARTDNFIAQVAQNVAPPPTSSPLYGAGNGGGGSSSSAALAGGRSTPTLRNQAAPPGLLGDGGAGAGAAGGLLSLNPVSDQQLLLMEEAQTTNTYIQQRGEAIEAIESTIAELGSIFGQLAGMVSEQSEMIERIEANTESVVDNVEGAQRELLKYWGRVSGNRWLVATNQHTMDRNFKLNTGADIPAVGLGTWQSAPGEVATAVEYAVTHGYRLVDGAYCYGNEEEVGQGLRAAFAQGVKREDVFVVSKVWTTYNTRVEEGLDKSLKALGLDYVDLYLVHFPVLLNPAGNDDRFPTLPDGSRDVVRDWQHTDAWTQMERVFQTTSKTRAIGVCNYSKPYLEQLLAMCTVVPAVNQIENHPALPQQEIVDLCRAKGIHIMAYSPFGSTGGPLFTAEPVVQIATAHGVPPAVVLLSYHIARGSTVLAKSVSPARIEANKALIDLTPDDMAALDAYSAQLTKEGRLQRFVYPPFGINLMFPDKQ